MVFPLKTLLDDRLTVISGLESRNKSVKQNNEGNKVKTFIMQLLVNQCSVHVKQKS